MQVILLILLSCLMGVFLKGYKEELIAINNNFPVVWLIVTYLFYCVLYNVIRIYSL